MKKKLHPFQKKALSEIIKNLIGKTLIIQIPTGLGKQLISKELKNAKEENS